MTNVPLGALLAVGVLGLAGCGSQPSNVATAESETTSEAYRVERVQEPFAIPGEDQSLEPATMHQEPVVDLDKVVSDARSLPEEFDDAAPRVLLGVYAPRSREVGVDAGQPPRLVYLLLFDVLSRPVGPPPRPGEAVSEIEPAPATVVAIYDAATGERLRASTVGCGVTDTCPST